VEVDGGTEAGREWVPKAGGRNRELGTVEVSWLGFARRMANGGWVEDMALR